VNVASVPVEQKRTCSAHGAARQIPSASASVGSLSWKHDGPPFPELFLDRGHHRGMRVPEHERSAAQDVIDVLAAGEVHEPRAVRLPRHNKRELQRRVVAVEHAAGQDAHGALQQGVFLRGAAGWLQRGPRRSGVENIGRLYTPRGRRPQRDSAPARGVRACPRGDDRR
jgi:hypothetical protein